MLAVMLAKFSKFSPRAPHHLFLQRKYARYLLKPSPLKPQGMADVITSRPSWKPKQIFSEPALTNWFRPITISRNFHQFSLRVPEPLLTKPNRSRVDVNPQKGIHPVGIESEIEPTRGIEGVRVREGNRAIRQTCRWNTHSRPFHQILKSLNKLFVCFTVTIISSSRDSDFLIHTTAPLDLGKSPICLCFSQAGTNGLLLAEEDWDMNSKDGLVSFCCT